MLQIVNIFEVQVYSVFASKQYFSRFHGATSSRTGGNKVNDKSLKRNISLFKINSLQFFLRFLKISTSFEEAI